ncbi:MAG: hypothetical protein EZS28_037036, partial [Streblomastix strix]
ASLVHIDLATFGIHVLIIQLCVVVRIIIQNVPEIPWELGNLKYLRLCQNTLLQLAGFRNHGGNIMMRWLLLRG